MKKLNVTILDMQPIDPPVGGGRLRLMGLYSGLDRNIEATYVGSYDWRGPKFRQHKLSENLTEIDVPLSEAHFKAHDDLSARLGKGCIDSAFPLQGRLSEELIARACEEAKKADVVVFSHQWLFPFVAPVLDEEKQLIVYDSQNCEGLLRVGLLDDGTPLADQICRGVVRCEHELCHAADLILACSQEDKQSFITLYGVEPDKIIIVPNGVFTSRIGPLEDAAEKEALRRRLKISKPAACFIGSNYAPNVEAGRLILQAAEMLPQYQFILLGGVGDQFRGIDAARYPNVIITGFLEENEKIDYLHACDIAINPMLSGSGTNIKMFDFMAAGLPIITTDIGARGIENTNGRIYRLCDHSAHSLAEQIQGLLGDQEQMLSLRKWGRLEAESRYSWESLSLGLGQTLVQKFDEKKNVTEKILMISTYPPEKCGIGAYAQQQVKYLRSHGAHVDVLAIRGNGKYHMELNTPEKILALKRFKTEYDRIIIQYHASFFYEGKDFMTRIKIHQAFTEVFRDNPNIEVVCHEILFPVDRGNTGEQYQQDLVENRYKCEKWKAVPLTIFHTETERTSFCEHLGIPCDPERTKVVLHHQHFIKARDIPQEQARTELGVPLDKKVFLCIGFIQPHKAFDRVAKAFTRMKDQKEKQFYMVGSLRLVYDETIQYLNLLQRYADTYPNIFLKSEFVSDELFDTWLIACDYVVIPYREIWTSGVLGRAKLFEKKCIVRNVGGLKEQLEDGDLMFEDYGELPRLLKDL